MFAVHEETTSLIYLRWNFFDTKPIKEELISQYIGRLENLASNCDFNNFTVRDALLQNLLNYKVRPEHRKEILKTHLDYEQVLKFAKSLENDFSEKRLQRSIPDDHDYAQPYKFKEEFVENHVDALEEINSLDDSIELIDMDQVKHEKQPMEEDKDNSKNLYNCEQCESTFEYKKALRTQMKNKHDLNDRNKALTCSKCNAVFSNNISLKRHCHKRHSKEADNHCIDCEKSFNSISQLNVHKKKLHNVEIEYITPLISTYTKKCPFCEQTYEIGMGELSSSKMKQHLERVHVKEDFSLLPDIFDNYKKGSIACDHCGHFYSCKSVLEHHKNVVHPETVESIGCHICGVKIKNKRALSQHLTSQHPKTTANYPCALCGKQFKSVGNLKIHENIHMARESPCDLCDKKFKSPYHVTKHKKMFHEKNYASRGVCDQCDKTFVTPYRLKLHIQAVHKQEKPFPCEICGFRCARFDNLNLHRKKTHKIEQNLTRIGLEKIISEGCHKFCSSDEQRPQYKNMNNTNSRINPT